VFVTHIIKVIVCAEIVNLKRQFNIKQIYNINLIIQRTGKRRS